MSGQGEGRGGYRGQGNNRGNRGGGDRGGGRGRGREDDDAARGRGGYRGRGGGAHDEEGGRGRGEGRGGYRGRGNDDRGDAQEALNVQQLSVSTLPSITCLDVMPHNFGGSRTQQIVVNQSVRAAGTTMTEAQRENEHRQIDEAKATVKRTIANVATMSPGTDGSRSGESLTNMFPVVVNEKATVYQYDIVIEPELYSRARRELINHLFQTSPVAKKAALAQKKIAYALSPLHRGNEKTVKLEYKGEPNGRGWRKKNYSVVLTFTNSVSNDAKGLSSQYYQYITSVLSAAQANAGLVKIAGIAYDFDEKYLPSVNVEHLDRYHSLRIVAGLRLVLHPTKKGLLLNADLTFRCTRRDTILDHINKTRQDPEYRRNAEAVIRDDLEGIQFITTYEHERRKQTFKVNKVRFDMTPLTPLKPNDTLNSKTYMHDVYGIDIKDDKQPLLEVVLQRELDPQGNPKVLYFLPELARFAGQSKKMRADTNIQKGLKSQCLLHCVTRFNRIFQLMGAFCAPSAPFANFLQPYSISVTPKMVTVPTRQLPKISIRGANDEIAQDRERRSWLVKRGLSIAKLSSPPRKWAFVHPQRSQVNEFISALMTDTINGVRANWPQPILVPYQAERDSRRNQRMLKEVVLPSLDEDIQFLVVVLPDNKEEVYSEVKRAGLVEWHIPSQCILERNVTDERKRMSVASRVGGQMLVKSGCLLWKADPWSIQKAMIWGIDFSGRKSGNPVVAVSATDSTFSFNIVLCRKYTGKAGAALQSLLTDTISSFKKALGYAPTSLVVYRSGMDEGDIPRIVDEELIPLQQQCTKNKLPLCFLASLLRTHLRILRPPAGIVIDDNILPPTGFSFYMVPQVVNIGTATAMKFSLLSNGIDSLTADNIERLTFTLCHMFYGWWSTTREPSVVMYAKRVAEMATLLNSTDIRTEGVGLCVL